MFEIVANSLSVDSMVVCDPLYFVVGFLSVFDTDTQSTTTLHEHLYHGHGAGESSTLLHRRSQLVASSDSTSLLDCPAPGHAATG